ncbi:hypothetical protein [Paenibacillus taichungensis]|uniref:hypothetical protein n=1 Tax=Paenibacillus taichungensis TaxID=484184 RepID=UPI0039A72EC0
MGGGPAGIGMASVLQDLGMPRFTVGAAFAAQLTGRQLVTSLGSALVLSWVWNWIA